MEAVKIARTSTKESVTPSDDAEKDESIQQEPQSDSTVVETTTSATPAEEDVEYIEGVKRFAVMAATTLVVFTMLLDTSILSTAVPYITTEFHSLSDVGWYVAAYQLSCSAMQPFTGKLYTFFRVKWTFLVFLFIFEVGSLVCGLANSSSMLIGGRALAGIGASGLMNGGMTVIAGSIPLQQRPLHTGILMGIGQLGIVLGPLIGGALTEDVSWRWCFYINLPCGGLAALVFCFIKVPELTVKPPLTLSSLRKTISELDLPGFALFAPAAIMFLLALQFGGNDYPWRSPTIIGLFCGAGVTGILFGLWESHMGDRAMIPGNIVMNRIVLTSTLQSMFLMSTIYVGGQYLPIYFQGVKGQSPIMSGVDLLPSILSQLLVVVVTGAMVAKLGYYLPYPIFSGLVTTVASGLLTTLSPSTSTAKWVGYLILLGGGRGGGMQMGMVAIQNSVSAAKTPISLTFLMMAQNFAAAVLVVVATVIFTQTLTTEITRLAPSVSPEAAIAAGASASAVHNLVPEGSDELQGVLEAFSLSVGRVFYLMVACGFISFVVAWGMGWVDTRKKKTPEKGSV
ncbi:major facilitator superfamily transporter [Xylariales sp. PMI_506]|nr:major facilitator superfamily transporter [Xylariales sp. PMI_506]